MEFTLFSKCEVVATYKTIGSYHEIVELGSQ